MAPERAFHSHSVEATEALGEALGRGLDAGAVVALVGELGAGKTALARGLARGLDVAEGATSPTFTLMHEHAGRVPLYHFDAWMAGREATFLEGGGSDYLGGDGVAVVEWAERVEAWLPLPRLELRLAHLGPEERLLELRVIGTGAAAGALEAALEALEPGPELLEVSPRGSEPPGAASVGDSA